MAKPYSYDLRSKAIEAVQRGKKKIEVSRFFKISRNTLDLWLKQEKETGDYKPKKPVAKGTRPKIEDLEQFGLFVAKNSGKTQKEMAQLWGNNISQQNISYACKKIGITRKKKLMAIKNAPQKKDESSPKS
jgi:transposase